MGYSVNTPRLIFEGVWKKVLQKQANGQTAMAMPQEIVWLMGSPASGKGMHSDSILRARGITNPPISISDLLRTNNQSKMDKGELVSTS